MAFNEKTISDFSLTSNVNNNIRFVIDNYVSGRLLTQSIRLSQIAGYVNNFGLDHGNLIGLNDDDHQFYSYLFGRSGGQILIGGTLAGDTLNLKSTSNPVLGRVTFGQANIFFDEVNDRFSIFGGAPAYSLDIGDHVRIQDGIKLYLGDGIDGQIYSSSDNLYIDNVTQNKNIYLRVNDGGVQTTIVTIEGSEPLFTLGCNLEFAAGKSLVVQDNSYAFAAHTDLDVGLYFSATNVRYEFRNAAPTALVEISASTITQTYLKINNIAGTLRHELNGSGLVTFSSPTDLAMEVLRIDQNDEDEPFIAFYGTLEAGNTKNITTWKTGAVLQGYVRLHVNWGAGSGDYWFAMFSAPTGA